MCETNPNHAIAHAPGFGVCLYRNEVGGQVLVVAFCGEREVECWELNRKQGETRLQQVDKARPCVSGHQTNHLPLEFGLPVFGLETE